MSKLVWGQASQLTFADQEEYYYSLGLLCNSNWFNIVYEPNKLTNSWGMHLESNVQIARLNCLKHLRMHLDHKIESTIMSMLKICITIMVFHMTGKSIFAGNTKQ